jgi:glycosyltransferase involved in cell wall biosynthesis
VDNPTLKLSVLVPSYNEGQGLADSVKRIESILKGLQVDYEILICDDDSNDGISEWAKDLFSDSVGYLRFSKRIGKGGTLKNAARVCNGEAIAFIDADIPVSSIEVKNAMGLLDSGNGLVLGIRRTRSGTPILRRVLSLGFNGLVVLFFRTGVRDHQCGFKIIDQSTAKALLPLVRADHFAFDTELIVSAKSREQVKQLVDDTSSQSIPHDVD